jgi:hypothetical protein
MGWRTRCGLALKPFCRHAQGLISVVDFCCLITINRSPFYSAQKFSFLLYIESNLQVALDSQKVYFCTMKRKVWGWMMRRKEEHKICIIKEFRRSGLSAPTKKFRASTA